MLFIKHETGIVQADSDPLIMLRISDHDDADSAGGWLCERFFSQSAFTSRCIRK